MRFPTRSLKIGPNDLDPCGEGFPRFPSLLHTNPIGRGLISLSFAVRYMKHMMIRASKFAIGLGCLASFVSAQNSAETFFKAIRSADLDTLRHASANPAGVKDRLDTTPLHYAALYGNTESVRILIDRGADVNARNKSGATPLIYAAYNFEKTRLLVEKGADVNAKSGGRHDTFARFRLRPRQYRDRSLPA